MLLTALVSALTAFPVVAVLVWAVIAPGEVLAAADELAAWADRVVSLPEGRGQHRKPRTGVA